jgi:uncharacterized protein YceH (UPF0502 family)
MLAARPDGPFVMKLPRQPGAREARHCQLLTGEPDLEALAAHGPAATAQAESSADPALHARVEALETAVTALQAELAALRSAPAG